jgi:hypothetical protein
MSRIQFELTEYCVEFCRQIRVNARSNMHARRKPNLKQSEEKRGYMPSDFMKGVSAYTQRAAIASAMP